MATIDFKTSELANLYLQGAASRADLIAFRNNGTAEIKDELAALDNRIATFQSAITDGSKVTGTEDFPYDKAFLKREFMDEVLGSLLKRGYGKGFTNVFTSATTSPTSTNPVVTGGLLAGKLYAAVSVAVPVGQPPKWSQGALIWDGGNFSNMTPAQVKSGLSASGGAIYDSYSAWIDAVFAEGNKLKNNPTDPATGATVVSKVVTAITERTIAGKVYDRITFDGATQKYYLIAKDAQLYQGQKVAQKGFRADGAAGSVTNGETIDSSIGLTPVGLPPNLGGPLANATYLEVDKDLNPISNVGIVSGQRNLSPVWYLYYWNEARVKVLRGQLNFLDAVASEIKDDLIKANKAYGDLEQQAGKPRSQDKDGKEPNPDAALETPNIDYFEATNSQAGTQLFDSDATSVLKTPLDGGNRINADEIGGHSHNYIQWQHNRSTLKAYIDRKSTDAQRATQDYQGLLNKFNSAYEIMSKLQEKMDGLVKGQLRNIS